MSRLAIGFCVTLLAGVSAFATMRWLEPLPPILSRYRINADHAPFRFSHQHDHSATSFRVDWPPVDPDNRRKLKSPPLLSGLLIVSTGSQTSQPQLNFRIELTRAESEADRLRWNRQLKFPEYDWMSRVRTWDRQQQWLWPNLPFLLKFDGVERQQRYGGIDPGKGVDNDFAAVVIRPLDPESSKSTLITARWNGPPGGTVDKRSLVHRAISDDLRLTVAASQRTGEVGVWLIYADFLDFSPPDSWPSEPEFDGGILSYFSVKWRRDGAGKLKILHAINTVPTDSTHVNWSN